MYSFVEIEILCSKIDVEITCDNIIRPRNWWKGKNEFTGNI